MGKKTLKFCILSLSLLLSCQVGNNLGGLNKNNFRISALTPDATESSPPLTYTEPPLNVEEAEPPKIDYSSNKPLTHPKEKIDFSKLPPDDLTQTPHRLIVFYHNNDKFRVKTSASVSSTNKSYENQVNSILDKYNVQAIHSYGYYDPLDAKKVICEDKKNKKKKDNDDKKFKVKENNEHENDDDKNDKDDSKCDSLNYVDSFVTNQALAQEQQDMSNYFEGEFPDKLSIHIYQFPNNINVRDVAKELRNLSFIRTAYPSIQATTSTSSPCNITSNVLGFSSKKMPNPSPPGDALFAGDEKFYWYWFNQIKAFKGWPVYGNTPMPKIAVIDSGFDIKSTGAIDRPDYEEGFSINYGSFLSWDWYDTKKGDIQEDIDPNDPNKVSHGTSVASIIASKKENGVGLSGVAPAAKILPVKLKFFGYEEMSKAIDIISEDTTVDAINLSIGPLNTVGILTDNPLFLRSVIFALRKNKTIVIAAGNEGGELVNSSRAFGSIIVGGTSNINTSNSNKREIDNTYIWKYSNYGSVVDISAPAESIYVQAYNPMTKQTNYKLESGTSFSAPQVAAAAGMVKKIAEANGVQLDPYQIRDILSYSSTLASDNKLYASSDPNKKELRYIGIDLSSNQKVVNIRQLNLYNALIIAKNLGNYDVILRQHNSDDLVISTTNSNWNSYFDLTGYGWDEIIGINNPNKYKTDINFRTYNYNGGYTYGYQLYVGKKYGDWINKSQLVGYNLFDSFDGVAGVSGANNNDLSKINKYVSQLGSTIYDSSAYTSCSSLSFGIKSSSFYGLNLNGTISSASNTLALDTKNLKAKADDALILAASGNLTNKKIFINGVQQNITGSNSTAIAFNLSNNLPFGVQNVTLTTDNGTIVLPNALDIQSQSQNNRFPTSITVNGVTTQLDYGYIFSPKSQDDYNDYSYNRLSGVKMTTRTSVDAPATWVNDNGSWGVDFSKSPFSAIEVPDGNYEFLKDYTTIALVKLVNDDSVNTDSNNGYLFSKWWDGHFNDHSKLNRFSNGQYEVGNTNQGKDPNTGNVYYDYTTDAKVTEKNNPFIISESLDTLSNVKNIVKNQNELTSTVNYFSSLYTNSISSVTNGAGRMFLGNFLAESDTYGLLWLGANSPPYYINSDLNLKGVLYGFAIVKQALSKEQIKELHKQMGY